MLYSRNKFRLVNIFLALLCVAVVIWILSLWIRPMPGPSLPVKEPPGRTAVREAAKVELGPAKAYSALEDKDLFRISRRKYVAPPAPKPVRVAAPAPPPPPPAPKLTLIGTLFLDDGWAALVVYPGSEASYYKVGDAMRDFTVKEIGKTYIVINRGNESVRYDMEQAGAKSAPGWPANK